MTPAEKILSLIETVDPSDTSALDEIDARVNCYLANREVHTLPNESGTFSSWALDTEGKIIPNSCSNHTEARWTKYTRSRDALKAIRPDGWYSSSDEWHGFYFTLTQYGKNYGQVCSPNHKNISEFGLAGKGRLQTEELAELHAIIQAIEWERKNNA